MKRQQFLPLVFALILLVSGATTLFTLWASSFSDYMAIEYLGLLVLIGSLVRGALVQRSKKV